MATGIVGAAVTVLGIMAAPIMIKAGYDARMSAGAIAAGGTLGILIPPSVMLVVMARCSASRSSTCTPRRSARASCSPACTSPTPGAQLPQSEARPAGADGRAARRPWGRALGDAFGMVPVDVLTVCTLGAILAGLATPTEAAARRRARRRSCSSLAYRQVHLQGPPRRLQQHHGHLEHGAVPRGRPRTCSARCSPGWARRTGSPTRCWRCRCRLGHDAAAGLVLIFLLGWPFEWPAIVLVFLPIFAPVARRSATTWSGSAHGRGGAADRVPVAAGGDVGLLPEAGGQGMEPRDHLPRHGRFHGHPGDLRRAGAGLPADRDVVSAAAGSRDRMAVPRPAAGRRSVESGELEAATRRSS